jgi:hypothetical protein
MKASLWGARLMALPGISRCLGAYELRPLRGRHAYKASLRSALPNSLQLSLEIWVSLHFARSRPWLSFFLFLKHQTSNAACFNARGLLYECVSTPSCFLRRTDMLGNLFLITSLLDLLSLLFLFWIVIPALLPATMLG